MSAFSLTEKPDWLGREALVLSLPVLPELHKALFAF